MNEKKKKKKKKKETKLANRMGKKENKNIFFSTDRLAFYVSISK